MNPKERKFLNEIPLQTLLKNPFMKQIATLLFLAFMCSSALGQETKFVSPKPDSALYDNELSFYVLSEQMRKYGEIEICIFSDSKNMCVGNLMTSFEIFIYDSNKKLLAKSIWLGMEMKLKFKKKYPNADYIEIRAVKPFVVNKSSGNRIYQDEPLMLTYSLRKWM